MNARIGTRTFSLVLNGWPPAQTAPVVPWGQSWSTLSERYGEPVTTALRQVFRDVQVRQLVHAVNSLHRSVSRAAITLTAQPITQNETPYGMHPLVSYLGQRSTPRVRLALPAGRSYGPLVLPEWSVPLLAGRYGIETQTTY